MNEPRGHIMGEFIVLLDDAGHAVGTEPKRAGHHRETPLHLAFSCYLTDDRGRVLLTRRAASKQTFPGVLTNSFCGHPAPGETMRAAVARRAADELGCGVADVSLVLPLFRYEARAADGTLENEWCPVTRAVVDGPVRPAPDEVGEAEWYDWDEAVLLSKEPEASPWFAAQVAELAPFGRPEEWPGGEVRKLPPAAIW